MKPKVKLKVLSLLRKTDLVMNTKVVKQTLHELIEQIDDKELLTIYLQLLERELRKNSSRDFFNTTEEELIARAKASIKSVEEGRSRSITEFKKDVEAWKNKRAI